MFQAFRDWRARQAEKDGVARFLVLTDAQVRNIIRQKPASLTALGQISGIGRGKIERYGQAILKVLHGIAPPRPPQPAAPLAPGAQPTDATVATPAPTTSPELTTLASPNGVTVAGSPA